MVVGIATVSALLWTLPLTRAAPQPFVVLSKQHSGTSFLREALSADPGLLMWTEIFLPRLPKKTGCSGPAFDRIDAVWGFKEWEGGNATNCLCRARKGECRYPPSIAFLKSQKAIGFTWMHGQSPRWSGSDQERIIKHLVKRNARVILLQRDNFLAHAIASSGLTQQATHSQVHLQSERTKHQTLDRDFDQFAQVASVSGVPVLRLSYEQLDRNYSVFEAIWDFLKLPPVQVHLGETPRIVGTNWHYTPDGSSKSHKYGPERYIVNIDDVRSKLSKEETCMLNDSCPLRPISIIL